MKNKEVIKGTNFQPPMEDMSQNPQWVLETVNITQPHNTMFCSIHTHLWYSLNYQVNHSKGLTIIIR